MTDVKTWMHPEKGRITGCVVAPGDWVVIRLTEPVKMGRDAIPAGRELVIRKSLLTEVL